MAEKIAAAAIEEGDEIPEAIASVPELDPYQLELYDAFTELNTCRFFTRGTEGPIPWTAIRAYATSEGMVDPDDFEFFRLVIRGLDRSYLAQIRKRRAEEYEQEKERRKTPPPKAPMVTRRR